MRKEVKKKAINIIAEAAELSGWEVSYGGTDLQYDEMFLTFTKQLKDKSEVALSFTLSFESPETIVVGMEDYIREYDIDYEAYQKLGSDGHGTAGFPYHIKDILANEEEIIDALHQLLSDLKKSGISTFNPAKEELMVEKEWSEHPFLTDSNKEYLKCQGYKDDDMPRIEIAAHTAVYTKDTDTEQDKKISRDEALRILGYFRFLTGLARCAFHGFATRGIEDGAIYFSIDE